MKFRQLLIFVYIAVIVILTGYTCVMLNFTETISMSMNNTDPKYLNHTSLKPWEFTLKEEHWVFVHFFIPFTVSIFSVSVFKSLCMIYGWETFEAICATLGSTIVISNKWSSSFFSSWIKESIGDSLIGDISIGITGILFGRYIMYHFFPKINESLKAGGGNTGDDGTATNGSDSSDGSMLVMSNIAKAYVTGGGDDNSYDLENNTSTSSTTITDTNTTGNSTTILRMLPEKKMMMMNNKNQVFQQGDGDCTVTSGGGSSSSWVSTGRSEAIQSIHVVYEKHRILFLFLFYFISGSWIEILGGVVFYYKATPTVGFPIGFIFYPFLKLLWTELFLFHISRYVITDITPVTNLQGGTTLVTRRDFNNFADMITFVFMWVYLSTLFLSTISYPVVFVGVGTCFITLLCILKK